MRQEGVHGDQDQGYVQRHLEVRDAEHAQGEDDDAGADSVSATEHSDGGDADPHAVVVGATAHSETEPYTNNPGAKAKAQGQGPMPS